MNDNKYKIGQSSDTSTISSYYSWAIWIEEEDSVLEEIESVTYLLHKTFPNPIKIKTNRDEKFIFRTSGWGTFLINIEISLVNGEQHFQSHYLILDENYNSSKIDKPIEADPESEEEKKPKIYLSYSSLLKKYADELGSKFKESGIKVIDVYDSPEGEPLEDFIQESIDESDHLISLKSKYDSPLLDIESELAKLKNKSTYSINLKNIDLKQNLNKQKLSILQNGVAKNIQIDDVINDITKI